MQIKDIYLNITKLKPTFKLRSNQLDMALMIAKYFTADSVKTDGANIVLIEAPTGTGKSLAYLIPGIVAAKEQKKKYVIATATKILQNQLIENDIPVVKQYSGLDFTFALAKGRANYLCPYQLELALTDHNQDIFSSTKHDFDKLQEIKYVFMHKKWNGDIDLAPIEISPKIKQMVITDKDRCLNYSCVYNQKNNCTCPYYLNREEVKNSDVVVTNHSLLLADINLENGGVFPFKLDEIFLCIDEGHNFIDNAIKGVSKSFSLLSTIHNCQNLAKLFYNSHNNTYLLKNKHQSDVIIELIDKVIATLEELNIVLSANKDKFLDNILILNEYLNPVVGTEFQDRFLNLLLISSELHQKLEEIINELKEELKNNTDSLIENNLNKIGFYTSVIAEIMQTSTYLVSQDESRYKANAKWVNLNLYKDKHEYVINASLTHVGNMLLTKLWRNVAAAVLTSATLAIGDDFNYYLHLLGLKALTKVQTLKLNTNFNYQKQAQIVVPRLKSAPDFNAKNEFIDELAQYLTTALDYTEGYGTLVLFFNKSQLQQVYNLLPKRIQQYILAQPDFVSNQRLIKQHKKNIDNAKPSIIFGLNSFAEGVDLPNIYCIHVIITKLPFETHKNPHNMVQEYWIRYEKGNYFAEISLPETCIRLIQASGRLIRSELDYGQITICDNRIINKNYGRILLDSLMPFNRKYDSQFIANAFIKLKQGDYNGTN